MSISCCIKECFASWVLECCISLFGWECDNTPFSYFILCCTVPSYFSWFILPASVWHLNVCVFFYYYYSYLNLAQTNFKLVFLHSGIDEHNTLQHLDACIFLCRGLKICLQFNMWLWRCNGKWHIWSTNLHQKNVWEIFENVIRQWLESPGCSHILYILVKLIIFLLGIYVSIDTLKGKSVYQWWSVGGLWCMTE
jgi:hypothetical protein